MDGEGRGGKEKRSGMRRMKRTRKRLRKAGVAEAGKSCPLTEK